MLDNLELPFVQEISTLEKRVLAEHKPPGMSGSLLQNMGRRPFRLALWGIAAGDEAQSFIDDLDNRYREGAPLSFTADIVADAQLEQVVIQDLRTQELAGKPERFAYVLSLREYIEPVEAEDPSVLDTEILADAQSLMGELVEGLNLSLDFVTGLERFVPQMSDFVTRLQEFGSAIGNNQ
jgi:hypothetical protein